MLHGSCEDVLPPNGIPKASYKDSNSEHITQSYNSGRRLKPKNHVQNIATPETNSKPGWCPQQILIARLDAIGVQRTHLTFSTRRINQNLIPGDPNAIG